MGRQRFVGPTLVAALVEQGRHPYVEGLRREGIPTAEIETGRRRYLWESRAIARVLRDHRVTLVHTHVYHADFVGFWAARSLGLPVVATVHGATEVDWKNDLYQWMDLRLLRYFDAIVCVSEFERQRLLRSGCPQRVLYLIKNGYAKTGALDRERACAALGVSPDATIVGWVGRLSREKGPDLFVRAFAQVDLPGALAVLIGEGPERDPTITLAAQLGIKHAIRLLGLRVDAAELFGAFACLVISSRKEGLPIVLWEAVASETPVVAFSVGGIPEVLTADAAWLVRPADTAGLASAITEAVTAREEARARAVRARTILEEHHGLAKWVNQLEELYTNVSRDRASQRR